MASTWSVMVVLAMPHPTRSKAMSTACDSVMGMVRLLHCEGDSHTAATCACVDATAIMSQARNRCESRLTDLNISK